MVERVPTTLSVALVSAISVLDNAISVGSALSWISNPFKSEAISAPVVTKTSRYPAGASLLIATVAVMLVVVLTSVDVAVTPSPEKLRVLLDVKFVSAALSSTVTVLPCPTCEGVILLISGIL